MNEAEFSIDEEDENYDNEVDYVDFHHFRNINIFFSVEKERLEVFDHRNCVFWKPSLLGIFRWI